jgi:peptidoglycan/xylan/chitin deacetylase (PgdA/CDA1 family)
MAFVRASLIWCCALALGAQTLALTFDDGPNWVRTPRLSPAERNEALLAALKAENAQAILFVNGIDGGDTPEGRQALAAWGQAGHLVGNHTYSHIRFKDLAAFKQDFLRCDALIKDLPGYARFFRFPYLKEGLTLEARDGMRKALAEAGYRNAHVTIPTFDWLIDERLRIRLRKEPQANLDPYRTYYLESVLRQADRARTLALKLAHREIKHTILLHHCLLNALFLGDLIRTLKVNGWTLVGPAEAYADPIYLQEPAKLSADATLLECLARERDMIQAAPLSLDQLYEQEKAALQGAGL